MGNWTKQQHEREKTYEKDKMRKENLGKFFYDLAKLVFGAIVLGGMVSLQNDTTKTSICYMISGGILFTYLLAWLGNRIF